MSFRGLMPAMAVRVGGFVRRLTISISFLMMIALLLASGPAILNAQTSLTVEPATLTFNMPAGSSQTQVMTVTTTPAGPFTVNVPPIFQSYLSVTPLSGTTTPTQVSVAVNS